jgi:HlyD family secretion protein
MMMRRTSLVAAVLTLLSLVSCSNHTGEPDGSGFIEATEIVVSSEAAGRLERLFVDEGDRIHPGDTIALVDTTTTALRLQQAESLRRALEAQRQSALIRTYQAASNDSLAQKEIRRITSLLASGTATQQQYDQAKNAADQAALTRRGTAAALQVTEADLAKTDAEIALLRKQYADCTPTAPRGGVVVTSYVEAGELISIGKPLIKVAALDTVWVKIYLPPDDLTRIKLGGRADVDPEDGRTTPLTGSISWISPEAEFTPKNVQTKEARADLVYAVKITVANEQGILKIGMPVSVRIP